MRDSNSSTIVAFIIGILYFCYLWFYPLTFNYELNNSFHYHFYCFAIGAFTIFGAISLFRNTNFNYSLAILIIFSIVLVSSYIVDPSNEHAVNLIVILIIVSLLLMFPAIDGYTLTAFFVVGYFSEIGLGIIQYFSVSNNYGYNIQGTFSNSGIYSCYLIISYPIVSFYLGSKLRNKTGLALNIVILFAVFLLIAVTESRTAWIAAIFYIVLIGCNKVNRSWSRKKLNNYLLIIAFIPLLLFFFYYMYNMKTLSAIGRVLIWKITISHWSDSFFWGIGAGNFSVKYLEWQSEYFNANKIYNNFFITAGPTYNAFNEFLNYFKEFGILRILPVLWVIFKLLLVRNDSHTGFQVSLRFTFIIASICSMTTYVFHSGTILLIIATLFTLSFSFNANRGGKYKTKILPGSRYFWTLLFLAIAVPLFYKAAINAYHVKQWSEFRKQQRKFNLQEQQIQFEFLYKHINFDAKFLHNYGEFVLENNLNTRKSINLLERACQKSTLPDLHYLLARAYIQSGDFLKAKDTLEFLSNMIPSKFEYKYQLMKCYTKLGNSKSAKNIASVIINMPVKIASPEVDEFKSKAFEYLNL